MLFTAGGSTIPGQGRNQGLFGRRRGFTVYLPTAIAIIVESYVNSTRANESHEKRDFGRGKSATGPGTASDARCVDE